MNGDTVAVVDKDAACDGVESALGEEKDEDEKVSVDSNVSVLSGVGVNRLDDEAVLVNEGKIVAESLNVIDDVDNGLAVTKPVEESAGDCVID